MSNWTHTIHGIEWGKYPLHERERIFQRIVKRSGIGFPQPPFAIFWEDPENPDAPASVTVPSPEWWAMALHGGIIPPVEVYHELAKDEAQPGFTHHTRGNLLHGETLGPLTEQQAIEYIVKKDIPPRVWRDYRGNRAILRIVPRSAIPANRTNRNAWRVSQEVTA